MDGSALTLNIFKEANWMKNISQEPIFDKTQDGAFIARHTGIYLLYAHVSLIVLQTIFEYVFDIIFGDFFYPRSYHKE